MKNIPNRVYLRRVALGKGHGKRGDTEVMGSIVTPSKARFLCLTLPKALFLRPGEVWGRSEKHHHLQCSMRARAQFILPRRLWFYG